LRIGIWSDDPSFPVHPPVARILASAVSKLRDAGHEIITIPNGPSLATALLTAVRSFGLDKDQAPIKPLREANEDLHPALEELIGQTFPEGHDPDLSEVWAVNASKEDIREEWAKVWWGNALDVLICPGSRSTAVPHGRYGPPAWTLVWNLLDVCSIPPRIVFFFLVIFSIFVWTNTNCNPSSPPVSSHISRRTRNWIASPWTIVSQVLSHTNSPPLISPYLRVLSHANQSTYPDDPAAVHGAPGSIQIVGWRFQDEEVLQATEIISQALHGQPPAAPVKSVLNRL
jgi:Asp-tRNA(Asn)/Glu-tRNA(Gln) amidotransferase A subunit family amidase